MFRYDVLVVALSFFLCLVHIAAFVARCQSPLVGTSTPKVGCLFAGYKFGDFSKSMINKISGKDEYKFGDLSRWLDERAKSAVNNMTGKDEYEFGDLSRLADSQIKERISNFTGKEQYEVGDISKEIMRRVASGDYKVEDVILLCKALASFGVGLSPVASALPTKLLLDMLNVGLAQEVSGRLMEALAISVDQRFKETITGDANYQVGDFTKRALLRFIGKEESGNYEFGDITRAVSKLLEEGEKEGATRKGKFGAVEATDKSGSMSLDPRVVEELVQWDLARNSSSVADP